MPLNRISACFIVFFAAHASAAHKIWTGAVDFTWNTTTANWSPSAWVNANSDNAIFDTTGVGTIDIATAISARALRFNVDGYTLSGLSTLTLVNAGTSGSFGLSAGEIEVLGSATATIDAKIGGSSGVTKTGTGTLVLGGTNTFTGGVTISQGVLSASANANLGATPNGVTIQGGTLRITGTSYTSTSRTITTVTSTTATIDIADAANTFTLTNATSGSGNINKTGPGTLVLGNSGNAYSSTILTSGVLSIFNGTYLGTGSLQFQGGTLRITDISPSSSGGGSIVVSPSGGTIEIVGANYNFSVGVGSGTGLLTKTGPGTLTLTGAGSGGTNIIGGSVSVDSPDRLGFTPVTFNGGRLFYTGPSTQTIFTFNSPLTINAGGGSFVPQNSTSQIVWAGKLTGAGQMSFTNIYVTLSNTANDHTGGTRLISLNTSASTGARLDVDNLAKLGTGSLTLQGSAAFGLVEGNAVFGYLGPTATYSSNILLDKGAGTGGSGGVVAVIESGTNLTLNGTISEINGTGRGFAVYGQPDGTAGVTVTGSNSYTGPTVVRLGAFLSISTIADGGINSPLGASSNAPANLVLNLGALRYTGATASTDRGLTMMQFGGVIDVTVPSTVLTISGQVVGTGFAKLGPGTLQLSNPNNTFVNFRLSSGVIAVSSSGNLGDPAGSLDFDGGKLQVNGSTPISVAQQVSLTANGGEIEVVEAAGVLNISGLIDSLSTGAGQLPLTKTGPGTLVLSRSGNTFRNGMTVNGGTISIPIDSSLGAFGSTNVGVLTLNGGTLRVTTASTTSSSRQIVLGNSGGIIEVAETTATYSLQSLNLNGPGMLTKTGPGTISIVIPTIHFGGTIINGGTLRANAGVVPVSGSSTGFGNVVVNNSGTLAGSGLIVPTAGNSVTINAGSTLHGGNATGNLSIESDNIFVILNQNAILDTQVRFNASTIQPGNVSADSNLVRLTGANNVLNLNPGSGNKFQINIRDTGTMQAYTNYTITLATVATLGNIRSNGVPLAAGETIGASNYLFTTSGFASTVDPSSVILFTDAATGTMLQMSFTTVPEPRWLLLCSCIFLGATIALTRSRLWKVSGC